MQNKIAVLGFRGVGKSTVSRLLHKKTGMPLYILDHEIEKSQGKNISDIVEAKGWNYFRGIELEHLKFAAEKKTLILDCGGGILEGPDGNFSEEKNEILAKNFFCIYLYLPDAMLLTRLQKMKNNSRRPGLPGDLKKTLEKRTPWFRKIANAEINTDGLSPQEVLNRMMEKIYCHA